MAADTQTLVFPLPKGIARDNSCQTQVVSTEHKLFNSPYFSYISMVCKETLTSYS